MNTERIKELMQSKDMSIYRLSKETGISDSLLGKILSGKVKDPRISTVKQIAKALDVKIDEIV
jgi:transcriptional regulator with XRE-family HTH domain